MPLEVFDNSDSTKWDALIKDSINGTLYHSWNWLRAMEKHCGARLYPLVYFDGKDNKPFAAIPLFHMVRFGLKMVFSPPPKSGVTLGPVFLDKGYRQRKFELSYLDFQENVDKYINKLGSSFTNIVTSPGFYDIRPFSWSRYDVSPRYTYKIDLRHGEEEIWKKFSRDFRTVLRHSESEGITVAESYNDDDANYVYDLTVNRYLEQHLPSPLKKEYFGEVLRGNRPGVTTLVASVGRERLGGAVLVNYKDRACMWIAGQADNRGNVNKALLWGSILHALKNGYSWFEDEGANTRRLCFHKSQACPELEMYFQLKRGNLLGLIAEKFYLLHNQHKF